MDKVYVFERTVVERVIAEDEETARTYLDSEEFELIDVCDVPENQQ